MEPLPLVKIDIQANEACRQNNDEKIKVETEIPLPGGNLEKFKIILGGAKAPDADEFTMV